MQAPLAPPVKWSNGKRFSILFFTVYFFFLILDFTSSDELFPHFVYLLLTPYTSFWDWIVPWTGKHLLHLGYPVTVKPNGSGDTTYNYVLQLLWILLALLLAALWTLADRKRTHYTSLAYWLRIVLRYYLAFILFTYGFIKIIKMQFPAPDLIRLTETYGNSSPMGLAWTFIGYSTGYNLFIGSAEVVAGLLLFFKRTTLLGSLIAMTVMMNVAAMNFAYDIPVKIFSLNLLLAAAYLAAYDLERIRNVFLLNRAAAPAYLPMPHPAKWKRVVQQSLKALAILFALYATLWTTWERRKEYGDLAPRPPLYGIYNIESFVKKGDTLLPLTTDTVRWKQLIINYPNSLQITTMTDSVQWMKLALDTVRQTALLTSWQDSTISYHFTYNRPDKEHLLFRGSIGGDSSIIRMKRFDETTFRLVSRGYHWINEYPYNR